MFVLLSRNALRESRVVALRAMLPLVAYFFPDEPPLFPEPRFAADGCAARAWARRRLVSDWSSPSSSPRPPHGAGRKTS
jgi:hypothetical protein